MTEYLLLAENITYKQNKLSCINIYDNIPVIAMPAEFIFDMAAICGPHWTVGEHKLSIKAKVNTGKEMPIGELNVNILNEDYVYNAIANNLKLLMDESITDITFTLYDNEKEVFSRKYIVSPMFVAKKEENSN